MKQEANTDRALGTGPLAGLLIHKATSGPGRSPPAAKDRQRGVTGPRRAPGPGSARTAGRAPPPLPLCKGVGTGLCGLLPAPAPYRWRRAAKARRAAASPPARPARGHTARPPAPPLAFGAANGAAAVRLGPPAAGRGRAVGWGGGEELND